MAKLGKYKVWDGELLHTVSEISWVQGGIKWYGPGVGEGWLYVNPEFDWNKEGLSENGKPECDTLLQVVTEFDY